jgi:transposase
MEDHPTAVIEKAKRLAQLLQSVEQGEPLAEVCAKLEMAVDAPRLAQLQAKYQAGGRTWEALLDGRYGHPIKAHSALREWLHERKRQDKELTAPQLVDGVKEQFGVELSAGHINYLLRKVELTRPPGRPPNQPAAEADSTEPEAPSQSLDNAGIFFPRSSEGRDGPPRGGRKLSGDGPPGVSGEKPRDFAAGGGE